MIFFGILSFYELQFSKLTKFNFKNFNSKSISEKGIENIVPKLKLLTNNKVCFPTILSCFTW